MQVLEKSAIFQIIMDLESKVVSVTGASKGTLCRREDLNLHSLTGTAP